MKLDIDRKKIIIIADDDDDSYILEEIYLRKTDIKNQIIRFCDGEEMIDFLKQEEIKGDPLWEKYIILMDIRMPKIDGISVLEFMKKNSCLQKTPVIMVSASSNPNFIAQCRNLGCSDYFVKPFDFEKAKEIKNNYL